MTPMSMAARTADPQLIQYLLDEGAQLTIEDLNKANLTLKKLNRLDDILESQGILKLKNTIRVEQ